MAEESVTPQEWIKIPYDWGAIRVYIYPAGANLMSFFRIFRANTRNSRFAVHYVARSLIVIASLSGLSTTANAADDTFACLTEMTGPLTELRGTTRYLENDWFYIPDGARFDAKGATFLAQTDPALPDGSIVGYVIDLRSDLSNSVCWAGGAIHYTNDYDITWGESKTPNNAALMSWTGDITFDGVRIHNAHDAIRPRRSPAAFWTIRNSWVTYNRDDCIENDFMAAGLVDDSLFDGCYVFLSSRIPDATDYGNTVTVQNSLIRMQEMPGPYGHEDPTIMGHGPLFKYQADSPDLVLKNNIFLMESYVTTRNTVRSQSASFDLLGFPKLAGCSGNVIVWTGPGEFPGNIPNDPSCVTVTTDRTVWDDARAKWLAEHPLVARIDGVDEAAPEPVPDPVPEPTPEPEPDPTPEPEPEPEPEPIPEPTPEPEPEPEPKPTKKGKGSGTTIQDTQDPSLTIISPVKGATTFPSTAIWVEVDVSDNVGVDRLVVHIDQNSPMVFEGGGTHGFSWVIPESWSGTRHSVRFVAYDLAGNSASKRYRFRMPRFRK